MSDRNKLAAKKAISFLGKNKNSKLIVTSKNVFNEIYGLIKRLYSLFDLEAKVKNNGSKIAINNHLPRIMLRIIDPPYFNSLNGIFSENIMFIFESWSEACIFVSSCYPHSKILIVDRLVKNA